MSADLVQRLRDPDRPGHQGLRREAADRIEELEKSAAAAEAKLVMARLEMDRLRAAREALVAGEGAACTT